MVPDTSQSVSTDVDAMHKQALRALQQGDFPTAQRLLEDLTLIAPKHVAGWTNLAGVRRATGNIEGALAAISSALTADPRAFFPLFLRGSILEQLGRLVEAASAYEIALVQEPPSETQDRHTIAGIAKARALIERMNAQKFTQLNQAALPFLRTQDTAFKARVEVLVGSMSGQRRHYEQQPLVFRYPHLPAIEFWDRAEFPWLESLEAATDSIIGEFIDVITTSSDRLTPYMKYPSDVPLDQWRELNQNLDWSAFHLIERGKPVPHNAQRCPQTLAALAHVPQPRLANRTPVALFSILKPKTHIPPHTGASNARLLCHLPLVVPEGCSFRVGGCWRQWTVGEAFVFDDTIEHEARNDSDEMRAVLIFDVENPRLKPEDYEVIQSLTDALDQFQTAGDVAQDWL